MISVPFKIIVQKKGVITGGVQITNYRGRVEWKSGEGEG